MKRDFYHPQDFEDVERIRTWQLVGLMVIVVAILCLASAIAGGEVRERMIQHEAAMAAEKPRAGTPQPSFASNFIDCGPGEVQRAREHIYACYRRELSSRLAR